jgi:hypothetical protein
MVSEFACGDAVERTVEILVGKPRPDSAYECCACDSTVADIGGGVVGDVLGHEPHRPVTQQKVTPPGAADDRSGSRVLAALKLWGL